MGRRENPLDPGAGPAQRFAFELRKLRDEAGGLTYRSMARHTPFSLTTLSQAAAGERLPTLPVALAYAVACGGDPQDWEHRWRKAAAAQAATERSAEDDPDQPYRGLARYGTGDRELFFGRDRLAADLLDLACRHRISALVGASGSGKSSLLRAGLIPRLRESDDPAVRPAAIRIVTPGGRPAATYCERLLPAEGTGTDADTWIIVDQFEEVHSLCTDPAERAAFVELLLAAREPGSRLRVVLAVRADFFGRLAEHRQLAEALGAATLLVGPMSREDLREAVVKPAATRGLVVERELTARIVAEVDGEPGGLPLMSHALLETWRRRSGRALTVQAYEAAGGLYGAIARTAEAVYAGFTPVQADLARRILLRLISPGDGTQDTRRPAPRAELGPDGPADAAAVLEQLARARLVTLDDDIVDLSHEALITAWPRLNAWIDAGRDRLRVHRQLTEAAEAWQHLGRDPGALYRGTRLAAAEEAFPGSSRDRDLTGEEAAFLTAGLRAREQERRTATRTARRFRGLAAALSVLVVLALVAGLIAWRQSLADERQRVLAEARRIASVADSLRSSDPVTAMRLSVAAWRVADTPETRSALVGAMEQQQQDLFRIPRSGTRTDTGTGQDTQLSADGRVAVTVVKGRVERWDVATHRLLSSFAIPGVAGADSLSVSPDGRTLALDTSTGVRLWNLLTGKQEGAPLPAWQGDSAFGPSGRTLVVRGWAAKAAIGGDLVTRLWSLSDRRILLERHVLTSGAQIAVGNGDGDAFVDASGGDERDVVSPDDRLMAVCPPTGSLQVWDVTRRRKLSGPWERAVRAAQCAAGAIVFTPNSHRLVVAGKTVRTWEVASGRELPGIDHPGVTELAFSADGRFLATLDGSELLLWRTSEAGDPVLRSTLIDESVSQLRIDLAGGAVRYLAGGSDPMVRSVRLGRATASGWQQGTATQALFSPDGELLGRAVQSAGSDRAEVIDVPSGQALAARLPTTPCPVPSGAAAEGGPDCVDLMAFSRDGGTFAVLSTEEETDTAPSRSVLTVLGTRSPFRRTGGSLPSAEDPGMIGDIALDPQGRILLVSGPQADDRTDLWDPVRQTRTGRLSGISGDGVALRPDGRLLVTSAGQVVRLPSGRVTLTHPFAEESVTALAFSADGRYLAVGDESGMVTLWDGQGEQRLGELPGPSAQSDQDSRVQLVTALAFSADGSTLAVGDSDADLRLWDVGSRQLTGTALSTPGDGILSLAFRPDGRTLLAAGEHIPLTSYTVDSTQVAVGVCRRTGGGLSRKDWQTYFRDVPYRKTC
ncbi:hypothetical protein ABZV24_40780 [Streptomyces sp. NPDC005251]|uniref:nSTAND1 domain-containing NTPase n=1 Tax=Streptomyces sp. NPDC005251 TaxID=3157166 RepID=UPI00339DF25E